MKVVVSSWSHGQLPRRTNSFRVKATRSIHFACMFPYLCLDEQQWSWFDGTYLCNFSSYVLPGRRFSCTGRLKSTSICLNNGHFHKKFSTAAVLYNIAPYTLWLSIITLCTLRACQSLKNYPSWEACAICDPPGHHVLLCLILRKCKTCWRTGRFIDGHGSALSAFLVILTQNHHLQIGSPIQDRSDKRQLLL
jgi:hypothetical protein